jgi:hypothetical protein
MFFSNIKWHLPIPLMPKKWHIDWALKFLVKICHVLTLRTHTINKFHHNNIIHHNRMLILITTRKSLPLVSDKVQPHFRQVLINIRQVSNIIPTQLLVVDFHRYIQRVRDVPHQHPTQASRNPRSNPELTRERRELPQLMMHLGGAITNKL